MTDLVIDEDQTSDAIDLSQHFTDIDAGDTLTYTATVGGDSINDEISGSTLAAHTFTNDSVGDHTMVVTATDTAGLTATQTINITVNNINDAAVISADSGTIAEGTASVTGTATHTDVDANNADNVFTVATNVASTYGTYSVDAAGAWTYSLDNTNTTVDALSATSTALTDTITVTAEDGTTKDISIAITGTNDAPKITSATAVDAPENGTAAAIITTTDAESDSITYSISGTDAALFSIDATSGVLTFNDAPEILSIAKEP